MHPITKVFLTLRIVLLHPDGTKVVTSLGTPIGTGDKNKEKIHIM